MEPHETGLSSYYQQHLQPSTTAPLQSDATETSAALTSAASPVSNGAHLLNYGDTAQTDGSTTTVLYPQSVPGNAPPPPPPLDSVKKKRGRPRKYASPEAAAAAKRAASSGLSPPPVSSKKRDQQMIGSASPSSTKKTQLGSEAYTTQGFMPHVISVNHGEDVVQRIRAFVDQSSKELCILSASGCVCRASLAQQAAAGGSITYEGRFDIVSLSGSFVRTDHGERSGGLSTCLVTQNGQIVGGGITGPVVAAGHVKVIVATFELDSKKDMNAAIKSEAVNTTMPSPTSTPVSAVSEYRPVFEPPAGFSGFTGMNDRQNIAANSFLMQQHGMHLGSSHPTDWRLGLESGGSFNFSFAGQTGHEANGTSANGNYEHLPD